MEKIRILFPNIKRVVKLSYEWMPFYTVALFVSNILIYSIPIVQAGVTGSIVNSIINALKDSGAGTRNIFLLIGLYVLVRLFSDFVTSVQAFLEKRWYNQFSSGQEILEIEAYGKLEQGHLDDSKFKALVETVRHKDFWPLMNLTMGQFVSLGTVAVFVTTTVLMFRINPVLIPILILSASFEFYVQLSYGKEVWNIWHRGGEDTKKFSHLKNHVTNKTASVQNQLFKTVGFIRTKAKNILENFNKEQALLDKKKMIRLFFSHAIASLGFGLAFFLIINDVIKGKIDVGTMVFYISILGQYVGNIDMFFKNLSDQYKQALEVNDIFKLVDATPYVKQNPNPTILKLKSAPKIEFRDVYFNYPHSTDKSIFAGLNLTIEPGEKIALVGNNGAGKTTLIKLLCRFYDPDKGEILIDGVNLKDLSKDEWYSYMSLLFQDYEAYLFKAKESIAMGQIDRPIDTDKIIQVSNSSGAHEFISGWKDTYDQQLGSEFGGISPSQGQEQKIAIARALYRNSFVLVLDEPTASVDALSEAAIFEEIRQSTVDRTLILISHRFNTVINMDRIIVIEHGRVIEEGNHAKLVKKKGGVYAKMFKSQASGYTEAVHV